MAHLVETMAYRNATPWHGLGSRLSEGQPLEVWQREAGMTWSVIEAPVQYRAGNYLHDFLDQKVLFRSDTLAPLSVVSKRYQVVQPREVLEFYRDLVEVGGFELETAGVLKGGRKLWALARTGQEAVLRGADAVRAYLLLATACDGTLATTAQFTSVRVVCNNTLQMAVGNSTGAVKVPHSTKFDAEAIKKELGIGISAWDAFIYRMKALSERRVTAGEAEALVKETFALPTFSETAANSASDAVLSLFHGKAIGATLESANDTAFGLLNAATEWIDHHRRARSPGNRLDSAWFGQGAVIKQRALDAALRLVA
jgi:phage/plasmid-like protein (TIGR03299 family)